MTILKNATVETLGGNPADEWEAAFAGFDLLHDVRFALRDWRGIGEIVQCLIAAGADLRSLRIERQADMFVCRCRMAGVSSTRARALAEALSEEGVAEAATVEHLMLAEGWRQTCGQPAPLPRSA